MPAPHGGREQLHLPQQLLHKECDIPACDGYGLDVAAYHVPIGHRDDMCNSISTVHNGACQSALQLHTTVAGSIHNKQAWLKATA